VVNNYNDMKLLTRAELKSMLPTWYKFKTKPWTHQLACTVASIANDGFLNCLDLGTGKTKVAIDFCRFLHHQNKGLRVLVVCLNSAVGNWADEVRFHSTLRVTQLQGTIVDRWALLKGCGFFVINFEGLRFLVSSKKEGILKPIRKKVDGRWVTVGEKKSKATMAVDNRLLGQLLDFDFDVLIIDESHMAKSDKSLTYKVLHKLASNIKHRLLLTGTPFGNSLLDVWAQYCLVDFGETYGNSFPRFKNAYFKDKGWFGPKWVVTESGKKVIESKLFSKAMRYNEDEVGELPAKVYRVGGFELSKEQRADYLRLLKNLPVGKGDIVNKVMVFRQICSGFIKKDDFVYKDNPKLDLLKEIIEQALRSSKVVVFHEFVQEGKMIEAMLKRMGVKFNTLRGGVKDPHKEYTQFKEDDEYKVMVAHPLSGGASINLVAAAYCVFYSNGYRVINRKQCEKRIHRAGQTSGRVFYYDLVGKSTIESIMLANLQKGVDAFDRIIDGVSLKRALMGL